MTRGQKIISEWYAKKGWQQFSFQKEMEIAFLDGYSGLLNAPTGSGKTFAMFLPFIAAYIDAHPDDYLIRKDNGLQLLWITPLRALTNDIRKAMQTVVEDLGLPWKVASRTGDTSAKEKQELKKKQPEVLLTTPESLHLMLAQKEYPKMFAGLQALVVDEWHELLGTKRGVQLELGLSRLKYLKRDTTLKVWGISATIGNLEEAAEVLLGNDIPAERICIIRAKLDKKIVIESVIPENIEEFSWAGHLGIKLLPQVMEIVSKSRTTLIFTNTRSQSEIWYMGILDKYPEYAGVMAMHHGSLDNDLRNWVEEALHNEMLRLVVCTSSLDLGVDFRPVDSVVQIGSPKGVARFMQRAGRSGHHPGATSKAWFVPTHSLELLEGAALKQAIADELFESRDPIVLAMDVLMQYLVTLAVSDGFYPAEVFREIKTSFAYADLEWKEFHQILDFITSGGKTLSQYDEFLKVEIADGLYKVNSRRVAMHHRLSMGTIVSDVNIRVRFLSGGSLGTIEEYFISKLKIGDTFWFAGRNLELLKFKDMTAFVRKSTGKKGIIPSWMGGRMPLSSQLSSKLRDKLDEVAVMMDHQSPEQHQDIEVRALKPLFELQSRLSHLPRKTEFLIEKFRSRDGFHLFFYPFEGRLVHEGMASLFAYRISKLKRVNFSLAMNDYGFELLTDEEILLEQALEMDLFSTENLLDDIQQSLNATEMARRKFRDIAHIAGLVFTGFPGKGMKSRHLQASTSLLFDVFSEYESDNVLVKQAYQEALQFQLEEFRLREALQRLQKLKIVITRSEQPTPFAFPILVDGLSREKLITETLEERVAKMTLKYQKS
ncbi:ATP-dependent helicase Lhr and Lhr-like helicase [Daejeonella rubra]|uniref:ATP-dependent helicase Lhr and Lhr-like helicase n=1 Tax=Daejeonella rubra TaxID=990371 RepID=A0A1G9Q2Y1_9SPHI|nr:ligase-associated DNA damage response DEXH box helicase [Daejeonella rubra]SDM05384.1 ATP-dependent helicase Lhr and Lhr-like helicase [Daejeonella rubra]